MMPTYNDAHLYSEAGYDAHLYSEAGYDAHLYSDAGYSSQIHLIQLLIPAAWLSAAIGKLDNYHRILYYLTQHTHIHVWGGAKTSDTKNIKIKNLKPNVVL